MNHVNQKLVFLILVISLLGFACKKVPFIPGSDAVVMLTAQPSIIAPGDSAQVILVGEKANGYPLPDGTVVYLTANTGTIAGQVTLLGGRAETTFLSSQGFFGDAMVTARCGQASISPSELIITVARQEVAYLYLQAHPAELPAQGGITNIIGQALDGDMNPLAGQRLYLTSDVGTLSQSGVMTTGSDGKIESQLTTSREAQVTVTHKDLETTILVTLAADNQPPTATFVYSPLNPVSDETIHFNAGGSGDSDGHITGYYWDLGDGKKRIGKTTTHFYRVSRTTTFVVTLKVIDNDGAESYYTKQITITKV